MIDRPMHSGNATSDELRAFQARVSQRMLAAALWIYLGEWLGKEAVMGRTEPRQL